MDQIQMGKRLRNLRVDRHLTQKQLADALHLSDKTISKWERGAGLPDVSVLPQLSALLGIGMETLLLGDSPTSGLLGGSMKNVSFYVCPTCGNLIMSTKNATITCCGELIKAQVMQKAGEAQKLKMEAVEHDWYITSNHPMTKENYISFVAVATGSMVQIIKQYPEWDLSVRFPRGGHGKLIWYSTSLGLFYQLF